MSRTCILTDSTVQFVKPFFSGHEHVNIIPHYVQVGERNIPDNIDLKVLSQYKKNHDDPPPVVHPPTTDAFDQMFSALGDKYQEIIAILLSSHISQAYANALEVASSLRCPARISIIDSHNTGVGLGLLVQKAAGALQRGGSGVEINRLVRGLIRHIYSIYCLPDLTYLHRSGQLDPAQAIVGEMLGVIPFYLMEHGRLIPIRKARGPRHLVDILNEFVMEFDDLKYLALVQGLPAFEQESRNLRERISQYCRTTHFSEHILGTALATILGPHSLGLVAMDNTYIET